MIVACSECGVKLKVDESKIKDTGSKLKCPKCGNIFTVYKPEAAPGGPAPVPPAAPPAAERQAPPPPPRPEARPAPPVHRWALDPKKAVVAHDGHAVLGLVNDILTGAGYEVVTAVEGVDAMIAIERERPFIAILDVALPRIYGFEICDRIKQNPESSHMKVVLIASIFDKTKYKREPVSLYGADDYIEKHHIQDCLLDKVKRLASLEEGAPRTKVVREEEIPRQAPPEEAPMRRQQAQEMRTDEIPAFTRPVTSDPQQVEAARRFARIILSDIALYNQSAVEEGIRNGDFRESLAAELKEGRDLYNGRVPEEVRNEMDYFEDEMEKFIEKKRRTMELGG